MTGSDYYQDNLVNYVAAFKNYYQEDAFVFCIIIYIHNQEDDTQI